MNTALGLTPQGVDLWICTAAEMLRQNMGVLNAANVFPVADSDTGTNMALTIASSSAAVRAYLVDNGLEHDAVGGPEDGTLSLSAPEITTSRKHVVGALSAAGRGALLGARGNSGVILAEFLTGLAQAAAGLAHLAPAWQLAEALTAAHEGASHAVGNPMDGTILTAGDLAQAQARGAAPAAGQGSVGTREVARAATDGAIGALESSPAMLAVLARSQVLDAGAYGLVLILAALEEALGGRPHEHAQRLDLKTTPHARTDSGPSWSGDFHDHTEIDGEFEVMMLVHAGPQIAPAPTTSRSLGRGTRLRRGLQELGESVVVVGGALSDTDQSDALWQCHVHTDVPEQVLRLVCGTVGSQGLIAGADVYQIVIRSLSAQVRQLDGQPGQHAEMVACTDLPGVAMDLARSGAVVVLRGTRDIRLKDIDRAALEFSGTPLVLTNSAELARRVEEKYAHVVPGRHDIHVIAAVAAITQEITSVVYSDPKERAVAPTPQELVQAACQVIAGVQYVMVEPAQTADLVSALEELFVTPGSPGALPVITVLVDQEFPTRYLTDLIAGIEYRDPEAEVITLGSGKLGTAATVCLEWM